MSIASITVDLTTIGVEAHDLPTWDPDSPTFKFVSEDGDIKDIKEIHRGQRFTVYRAKLGTPNVGGDVVLKILRHYVRASPEAVMLQREASRYENELSTVQGEIVPRCFGFFRVDCNGLWISCLVLQYCGEPRHMFFWQMDRPYRYKIIVRLGRIHDLHLSHGDFHEPNVLDDNGNPFIVGFERANDHGICDRDVLIPGQYCPTGPEEFGCKELYNVAAELGLWRERYIEAGGHCIAKPDINSAEDIVAIINPPPKRYSQVLGRVRALADRVLEEKKVMDEELQEMQKKYLEDQEQERDTEPA
ncbi:hypothetical protein PLICRDRAFT_40118 [Plicaturopsis crispa FD-325 SS-3]|nr:hypothetical protein PLICRDRAFT_40118 [Plicaturopsis crispa FD-325 SS-3]